MEFKAERLDGANAVVTAKITKDLIEKNLNKVAKSAAKNLDIQGFRKGKVPVALVKKRYASKLEEDAQGEILRDLLSKALDELKIKDDDLANEPTFSKYEKQDNGDLDVKMDISCNPAINLGDYKSFLPEVKDKKVSDEEVTKKLNEMAKNSAPLETIKTKRAVKNGDFAVIDFEGFIDDVAFKGGKSEKYPLEIGSNSFIQGFEEQIIGMEYEEQKDIIVTFPEKYQAKELAGKKATFKVVLHEIQEKVVGKMDDEFAKKMLTDKKDVTLETLKNKIQKDIKTEQMNKYYIEELGPLYLETLVEKVDFALPRSIIEQELNMLLNEKLRHMSEQELKDSKEDSSILYEMRDQLKDEAKKSVKKTFIVNELAKVENIDVSNEEVGQFIYYEALRMGKDPKELLKQYQKEAAYLIAIRVLISEEKIITKLLNEKLGK